MADQRMELLAQLMAECCDDIAARYNVPVKVSIVVRQPGHEDRNVFFGSDTAEEAMTAIARAEDQSKRIGGVLAVDGNGEVIQVSEFGDRGH